MGCASIRLRGKRSLEYMSILLSKSNKGWHKLWFYLRNDAATPLPIFTGHLIELAPDTWRHRPIAKEQKRLGNLLKAIVTLKGHGLHRTSIVGAYHIRRLDSMPEGTMMVVGEALSVDKTAQYIKEAMECPLDPSVDLAPVYPVPGHPAMWPDMGFVELVSLLRVSFLGQPSSVLRF